MRITNCLGDLKAEIEVQDGTLNEVFLSDTKEFRELQEPHYTLLAAKKGAGKSALIHQVIAELAKKGEFSEVLIPTEFSVGDLDELRASVEKFPGFPIDTLMQNVWYYIIVTTVMKIVMENQLFSENAELKDIDCVTTFVEQHNLGRKGSRAQFIDICRQVIDRLKNPGGASDKPVFLVNVATAIKEVLDGHVYDSSSTVSNLKVS
jgi:predicted ATP-dependent serine protease